MQYYIAPICLRYNLQALMTRIAVLIVQRLKLYDKGKIVFKYKSIILIPDPYIPKKSSSYKYYLMKRERI